MEKLIKKPSLNSQYKTLAEYLSSVGYHTLWGSSVNPQSIHLNSKDSEGRGFQTELYSKRQKTQAALIYLTRNLPIFFKWLNHNPQKNFLLSYTLEMFMIPIITKLHILITLLFLQPLIIKEISPEHLKKL